MRRAGAIFLAVAALALLAAPAAQAALGVANFDLTYTNEDGSADAQAGSHPFAVSNFLTLTEQEIPVYGLVPSGALKDVTVSVPEGLVGDPNATPQCTGPQFASIRNEPKLPSCQNKTAVGTIIGGIYYANETGRRHSFFSTPVYNLEPPPGAVEKLGFVLAGVPVTINFTVNTTAPYNVVAHLHYVSQVAPVFGSELRLWGNPENPIHDRERGDCIEPLRSTKPGEVQTDGGSCGSEGAPERAFLTLPRACEGELTSAFSITSWEEPAAPASGSVGTPRAPGFLGCEALRFGPTIAAKTTESAASSPTGLNFNLDVDDPGLTDPNGIANSDIKKTVVTLPKGVTTNPAAVSGLSGCTQGQFESETIDSQPGTGCPESSKVGTVEVETPLLENVILPGSIYVAKQGDNEFHNLLTIDMVIKDPQRGILVRLAGRVDPDPQTGQLTTTFDDLPQLPFSHFRFHFRDGQRAPLITPALCGKYTTIADLYPYSNPTVPLRQTADFEVSAGANGHQCATSESQLPVQASFSAGTASPIAGTYSPFLLKLQREDGSQELSAISTKLPQGLLARLTGIPYCPESGIAQAESRSGEGQGALEVASPSCPAASEVGTVTVGAGAGNQPYYVTGHAFLAGPYKGAPLSLEIITPAIAGPFDLGTVAVRTALHVDLTTAEVTAVSDPIPTILHGLPLVVRSIAIDVNRPNFTLNPTSCEPKAITGSITSTLNQSTPISQYFQVEKCERLKFKPTLRIHLKGKTRRAGHPALKAVLTYPKKGAYANVARAQVGLPHSEFLDQGNIGTVCTQPQLRSKTCPKKSIYGRAKAWSPLLAKPLSGPVYLGVGYGHKLPDLVADLDGQIRVLLNGKVDQTKQKGLRNTFEAVPDAPVSKFILELKGGPKYGLLENSENICLKPQRASTQFIAQNGVVLTTRTPIQNECKTGKKGKKKHSGGHGGKKHQGKKHGH